MRIPTLDSRAQGKTFCDVNDTIIIDIMYFSQLIYQEIILQYFLGRPFVSYAWHGYYDG